MSEDRIFARLRSGRRTWAVAAIHGEADRLRRLHGALEERFRVGDGLVYLGNFLGLGGAVGETVEELLLFRRALLARPGAHCRDIVYLRGSQEEMWHKLLQIQFATGPREILNWMLERGVAATLEAYGGTAERGMEAAERGAVALTEWTSGLRDAMRRLDGHNALMSDLRHAAHAGKGSVLFVNSGVDTRRPLNFQGDAFWWGGQDFDRIGEPYDGFGRVVRGFDPGHGGMRIEPVAVTIDGGCGFGGPLVAACFDAGGELTDTLEA